MPRLKIIVALSLFAPLLVLVGCRTIERPPEVPVTVMTYNVYVGSSAEPALETKNLFQIPVVVGELYGNVIASDFAARAAAIATIVKESQPHVIGLQEIELIRRQDPSDFLYDRSPNAEEIDLDYLEILMDALHAEGLDYQVAAKVQNLDLEMPMLAAGKVTDVRLTDFDVILTRGDVVVSRPTAANYAAGLPIAPLGLQVARGYVAIDATIDDVTYRIVNTHLESVDPGPRVAQAQELVDVLAGEELPVILLGDFNTRAPDGEAYQLLLEAGYLDVWQTDSERSGATCCQADDLRNEASELTNRIDQIFVKGVALHPAGSIRTLTVGDKPDDRLPSGLWPSDHAGVVAQLPVE